MACARSTGKPKCCRSTGRAKPCSRSPRPSWTRRAATPSWFAPTRSTRSTRVRRLLAGARPHYVNATPERGFARRLRFGARGSLAPHRLLYVCSPGNPTGKVLGLDEWKEIFSLSDRHGFIVASDECYSEVYFDEGSAPLGALQAATQLGRGFERLVVFSSLSKRSNVPGMRSGFVAGDAVDPQAVPAVPHLSRQRDEPGGAGRERRGLARRGPRAREPQEIRREIRHASPRCCSARLRVEPPRRDSICGRRRRSRIPSSPGGSTPSSTSPCSRELSRARVGRRQSRAPTACRMALVAETDECLEAARRIVEFTNTL